MKELTIKKNIEPFIACDSEFGDAEIVIFGAPFDGTASFRPGARYAPKAVRAESFGIETYSPYQDRDLNDIHVCDYGDLELPFGNTAKTLLMIEDFTDFLCSHNKLPFMIGGEHLVTLGAVKSILRRDHDLHVIQFDAHADLRDDYLGERLSHATVMRRIWELTGDGKIHQFGIRSGERAEFEFARKHTHMCKYGLDKIEKTVQELDGKPVYLTVDVDVLDPSVLPGTGTPEAGGVIFYELFMALLKLSSLNIVGCDITELSPIYDRDGISTITACKLIREILLISV